MTLAGYILMTVLYNREVFEEVTMSTTQVVLSADVDCEKAARDMEQRKIVSRAYCIPLYSN